jgi:ribonuclease BN (tRNA processing enzyme)
MIDSGASGLRLRFLGSGDAFGSGGRFQACLCLDGPGNRVLIDCGATSLVAMKRAGIDPNSIGTVLLSHLHGDHFGGVPFLVLDGQFRRRDRPLTVAGPPGTRSESSPPWRFCSPAHPARTAVFTPSSSRSRQGRPPPSGR